MDIKENGNKKKEQGQEHETNTEETETETTTQPQHHPQPPHQPQKQWNHYAINLGYLRAAIASYQRALSIRTICFGTFNIDVMAYGHTSHVTCHMAMDHASCILCRHVMSCHVMSCHDVMCR